MRRGPAATAGCSRRIRRRRESPTSPARTGC